jgi:putative phosphoesterase
MKILLISDIHANIEALTRVDSVERPFDHVFCMGDLVDYGPSPRECITWLRDHEADTVRGNHDNAVGLHADCGCVPPYLTLSQETRRVMWQILNEDEQRWLAELPITLEKTVAGHRFHLFHAAPQQLTLYLPPQTPANRWIQLFGQIDAEFFLLGHTHMQMDFAIDGRRFVNPGSVGQPKPRGQMAHYGVWEDGEIHLKAVSYEYTKTQDKIRALPLARDIQERLCWILENGNLDAYPAAKKQ